MTTAPLIRSDHVTALLHRYAARRALGGMLTAQEVRALAEYYRTGNEAASALADDLDALADKVERRAAINKHLEGRAPR